jgi:hypothetical protein
VTEDFQKVFRAGDGSNESVGLSRSTEEFGSVDMAAGLRIGKAVDHPIACSSRLRGGDGR